MKKKMTSMLTSPDMGEYSPFRLTCVYVLLYQTCVKEYNPMTTLRYSLLVRLSRKR
jgi:hypothetical protein